MDPKWRLVMFSISLLSRVMRKPDIYICENKGTDQLRNNCAFVFATWKVQSLFFLNKKFQATSIFCVCTAWFVSKLVENPEGSFSRDEAHLLYPRKNEGLKGVYCFHVVCPSFCIYARLSIRPSARNVFVFPSYLKTSAMEIHQILHEH